MNYVLAGLGASALFLTIDVIYEIQLYRKLIRVEAKRHYYPLDFTRSTRFNFKRPSVDLFEISDEKGDLRYKLQKSLKSNLLRENWSLLSAGPQTFTEVAVMHYRKCMIWGESYVQLSLSKTPSTSTEFGASNDSRGDIQLESARPSFGINTSSPITILREDLLDYSSPFVDSSLTDNYNVKRKSLGNTDMIISDTELKSFEVRKLHKIVVYVKHSIFTSSFQIAKNSVKYIWRSNGYLEKESKNKVNVSTERIGFLKPIDRSHGEWKIYFRKERMEEVVALTTATLHVLSNG